MTNDIETVKAEFAYIRGTLWYKKILEEADEYLTHRMNSLLSCSDLQRLGFLQGQVKAVEDFKNKLLREE